jgi:CO dehydrogenase maturation factor
MRIAFVGGKGSGKSTCAAMFSRYLANCGRPVLAVDAVADRRLGALLGRPAPPCWSAEHLGGARPVVALGAEGLGPVAGRPTCPSAAAVDGVRLVATDVLDVLLEHLVDGAGEYVVIDIATDGVASSRFDLTVLVAEPTRRAAEHYREHAERAAVEGAALCVLGNKTSDWGDAARLTEQMGDALLGCVGHSAWVRAAERGTAVSITGLEPANTVALAAMRSALNGRRPLNMQQQGGPLSGHPAVVERAYSASRR